MSPKQKQAVWESAVTSVTGGSLSLLGGSIQARTLSSCLSCVAAVSGLVPCWSGPWPAGLAPGLISGFDPMDLPHHHRPAWQSQQYRLTLVVAWVRPTQFLKEAPLLVKLEPPLCALPSPLAHLPLSHLGSPSFEVRPTLADPWQMCPQAFWKLYVGKQ